MATISRLRAEHPANLTLSDIQLTLIKLFIVGDGQGGVRFLGLQPLRWLGGMLTTFPPSIVIVCDHEGSWTKRALNYCV